MESVAKACQSVSREYKDLGYKGKIIVMSESGFTASMVSKYRPPLPIVVPSIEPSSPLLMLMCLCFIFFFIFFLQFVRFRLLRLENALLVV